jgi:membrane-bound serine protease (ClpP class)
VARFLSDPTIAGLLMSLGMLGILMELYSPGHGIGLAVGLTCLALFFFGHHVVNLAGWEEILLFVVGVGLLVFEVTVPGHILPGVIGVILIVVALGLALVNFEAVPLVVAWRAGWIQQALANVFGSILITAALTWGLAKVLPRTSFGRPLVLQASLAGMHAGATPVQPVRAGARGQAITDLRPSGTARFGADKLEVALETGFARAGATIEVVAVEGQHITVKAVQA